MKKQCLVLALALLLSSTSLVHAKASQWSLMGENKAGSYYTDLQSFQQNKKEPGTTHASARAVFKNTSFVRLLNEQYDNKLKALDSAAECIMQVSLNLKDHSYRIDEIQLLSKKGKVLDKKKVNEAFSPIPEETFVASLAKEAAAWQVEHAASIKKSAVKPVRKKIPRHSKVAAQKSRATVKKTVPKKEGNEHG